MTNPNQETLGNAFRWVLQAYDEVQVMLNDALRLLSERGMVDWGLYEVWASEKLLPLSCRCVYRRVDEASTSGVAAFIGVSFYRGERSGGPVAFGGCFDWKGEDTKPDTQLMRATVHERGWDDRFEQKRDAEICISTPTETGREKHPGIEVVKHFELPLTYIDSQERLKVLVDAVVALRAGSEKEAREFVRRAAAVGVRAGDFSA